MAGPRAPAALLLALVLVPAGALATLGFRATVRLENRLDGAEEARTLRAAATLPAALAREEADAAERFRSAADEAARAVAAALPGGSLRTSREAVARRLGLAPGDVGLDVQGRAVLPPPADADPLRGLPEFPVFREIADEAARVEFAKGDPEAAAALLETTAPKFRAASLRARAWALAAALRSRHPRGGGEDALARLRELPEDAVIGAGIAAWLALHPAGEAPLPDALAAPDWLRVGGAGARVTERAPLPAGATLEVTVPAPLPASRTVDEREISFRRAPAHLPGVRIHDGETVVGATYFGAPVEARVVDPRRAERERESAARRLLAAAAGAGLLALVAGGLWLVRHALARERAARRLRDDFIANVSHDLRTPIASVRLHAEMLAEPDVPEERARAYAHTLEAEAARLAALVEDLLDFSALDRGARRVECEPTDLGAAVEAAAEAWRPIAARDGVELLVERAPEGPVALADPVALSRILANLVQNALQHGGPARSGARRVVLRARTGPALEVADNGPGVPAGERERVFERFARGALSGRTPGAGLGLALSRELARAMGGELSLRPNGKETSFELRLRSVA